MRTRTLLAPIVVGLLATAALAAEPKVYFAPQDDFQKALVKEILSAKTSVDIALYSFQPTSKEKDANYKSLKKRGEITPMDAIREAVKKKVKVRVVLNHAHIDVNNRRAATALIEAGAKVYTVSGTMHSKFAVIDGNRVINGSGNWSIGAFHRYHENWIVFPPDAKLAAPFKKNMETLVAEKRELVNDKKTGVARLKSKKAKKDSKKRNKTSAGVTFTSDNNGKKTTIVEDVLVKHMKGAKKEIQIAVAHFNTQRLADAVIAAKKRGLKVRVLVDLGEYRNRVSKAAALEKAKVDVRYHAYSVKMFFPYAQLMHHKMLIVDGKTLISGSYNWSRTAEHGNHENIQVLKQPSLLKAFKKEYEALWTLRRDVYPKFMARLKAKKGTKEYRRFLPNHFKPMALSGKEMAALRRIYVKQGFAFRPYKKKRPTSEYWNLDREKRTGTSDPLPAKAKPFFDVATLVISEACYQPKKQDSGEFVELYNGSDEAIDLAGWKLSDGDADDTIVALGKRKTVLKPGKFALVVDPDHSAKGDFKLPKGVVVVTVGNASIGNGLSKGDLLTLASPQGATVDTCPLTKKTPKGESVRRKDLAQDGAPANWETGASTPGKVN
jgi:phosphatidylserine/phosphatidylglycerophosphate/cardiolipin synthase-like enzyme